MGLDDYRASKLNANIFAVTDFVLPPKNIPPVLWAWLPPAQRSVIPINAGSWPMMGPTLLLPPMPPWDMVFGQLIAVRSMSSLPQPAYENYVAAITGGTTAAAPTVPTSAAGGTTSPGLISNSNPGSSDNKSPGIVNTAPSAPAGAPSEVMSTTSNMATLKANLSRLGSLSPEAVSFEYGLTTSYGSISKSIDRSSIGDFLITISNLMPNTTYHFRVKAVGKKTFFGADQTFTTAGIKTRQFHKRSNGKNWGPDIKRVE